MEAKSGFRWRESSRGRLQRHPWRVGQAVSLARVWPSSRTLGRVSGRPREGPMESRCPAPPDRVYVAVRVSPLGLRHRWLRLAAIGSPRATFGYKDGGNRLRRAHLESSLATQMPWLCVSAPLGCLTSRPLGRRWASGLGLAAAGPPSRFERVNRLSFVDFPPGRTVSRPAFVARFGR